MPMKIISGGQTGVDRAALDAALQNGINCGGCCPAGRMAEDGRIPECYPLTELVGAGYKQRTLQNVIDSDGTVIIYFGELFGGTKQTLRFCRQQNNPYLLIDADAIIPVRSAERIKQFVTRQEIHVLNVAGPRASNNSTAYGYTLETISIFLSVQ